MPHPLGTVFLFSEPLEQSLVSRPGHLEGHFKLYSRMYCFILFNKSYAKVEYGRDRYLFLRLWIILPGRIHTVLSGDKALNSVVNYFIN